MKRTIAAMMILACLSMLRGWAQESLVYVLNLDDEVNAKMWLQTRRACNEAIANNADLMVVHINTYGGAVDSADSIRTALLRIPIPTVAFVDLNAASAGALITLACDSVYMSPGASLGASTVVDQSGTPMPDKYQAYMKSIMRATAESHGKKWSDADSAWVWRRDPQIAEGMVRVDSVTSLTADEAVLVGYAEGKATSVDEVIRHHIDGPYKTQHFQSTATDSILGFLANAAVRAVLIMLILGGIYMEMHSPGLGIPSAVAIVAAVLYFLPSIVSGTMASWVVIVFLIGVILLALEIFVIPGFGVCGITGIVAILASLVGGMFNGDSLEGGYAVDIVQALTITVVGMLLAVAAVWFLTSKYGPKCVRRVSELQTELRTADGYTSVDAALKRYVGLQGWTVTDLRPSGKIEIDGQRLDAVSTEGYIDSGRCVIVTKFENAQLYVKKA